MKDMSDMRDTKSSRERRGGLSRRRFLTTSAIALTTAAAAGLGLAPAAQAATPGIDAANKVVRVGAFAPLTGPVPFYAVINNAADAFFKDLNERGGIQGWKVEYIIRDDGFDPSQSLAVTRRLVEDDDVFALVVSNGTPTNIAIIPYIRQKGLPVIAPSAGSSKFAAEATMFPLLPDYSLSAASSAKYATEKLGAKKIALIWQNDEMGRRAKFGLETYLKSIDMAPIADVSFDVGQTDLTAQVQRIASAEADVVLLYGSNAHLASALRAGDRISYKGTWFAPFFTADPTTYELAGDLLDGVHFSSWLLPLDEERDNIRSYRETVPKYYPNDKQGPFGLNGWTAASLFTHAFDALLTSGKEVTRENLVEVMNNLTDVQAGAADKITFTAEDHRGTRQETIIKAEGGKFRVVEEFRPYPDVVFNVAPE